jgi:hypothetical protein
MQQRQNIHKSRASHTAKTHESRTNYAHIFLSTQSVRCMRNSSVERTWTVSDCKWMCVRRRRFVHDFEFWTVQNFFDAQLCVGVRNSWVGVRSLCVKYVWLCAGHALAVSTYASELVRNRARPRSSTDTPRSHYAWSARLTRSFHWHPLPITYVRKVIHMSGVCRVYVKYCTVFARMRRRVRYINDSSVIVSDTCAVDSWFVSDFYPRHPEKLVDFSTHKHTETESVRDLWVIRGWLAVWLALHIVGRT